jgi:hypothetical protein
MLRQHPQIYMPDLKEPWFFASDLFPRFQPKRSGTTPRSLDDYRSLFTTARPDQLIGEATSCYLRSHVAAQRIAELRPDARIIAILREPAGFLRSLHLQLLHDHIETERDFRKAISLEPARREGRKIPRRSHLPQLLFYSEYVRYGEQLARYRAAFPAEQLLVLIYDDLRRNNLSAVESVQRFLGVAGDPMIEAKDVNQTIGRMRSQRLDNLVNTVSVGRGPVSRVVKSGVKTVVPPTIRAKGLSQARRRVIHGKLPGVDEEFVSELRRRFAPEVETLSELLGRDLVALWAYDDVRES